MLIDENYEIPETAQIDELQTFVGTKKQSLALDRGEYKAARHSQVCSGQPLSRDVSMPLVEDPRVGCFLYITDGYKVYPCLIDDADPLVSKTAMTRVEAQSVEYFFLPWLAKRTSSDSLLNIQSAFQLTSLS